MGAVFEKLKLNTAGEKLFENQKFLAWVKYVDDYNDKNPLKPKSIYSTLMKEYNDEPLSKMLEAAKQVKNLQASRWCARYPAINIWVRYADKFAPGTKTTLFETLQKHYSDKTLSQVVIAVMKVPDTEKVAVDLQKQQIHICLDKLESPENVFKLLMLDKGADSILVNPQLKVWTNYALAFKDHTKGNPVTTTQTNLLDMLMKSYSPKNLATIIDTAKNNPNTKRMANYVQDELIGKWVLAGKPLPYVSKVLGISKEEKVLVHKICMAKLDKIRTD